MGEYALRGETALNGVMNAWELGDSALGTLFGIGADRPSSNQKVADVLAFVNHAWSDLELALGRDVQMVFTECMNRGGFPRYNLRRIPHLFTEIGRPTVGVLGPEKLADQLREEREKLERNPNLSRDEARRLYEILHPLSTSYGLIADGLLYGC